MKLCHKERRIAEVPAGISWVPTLGHRIYSCPDTDAYESSVGASCLLLTSKADGRRVFLNVEAVEVCNPHARDFQNAVPAKFRARLVSYKKAVPPDILGGHFDYRFYFLSDEPWPEWLQKFTPQEHCPDLEWKAVLASWLDSR